MTINYATQYSQALANAYPSVLYSGKLWASQDNAKYKVVNAKTIEIPRLTVGGRVDGDRTTIGDFTQNFSNDWETKTLENHRVWQTLVHPQDVNQTNMVASISNITQTMNEEQKFPEMDAYLFSKLYELKNAKDAVTPETAVLTSASALAKFDSMMDAMDEARVPASGRQLYVDTFTKTLLDNAIAISRANGDKVISRMVNRLDEVELISVPSSLMKTAFTFTDGFAPAEGAKNIAMMLVHPSAIIPVVSYQFAQMQAPSALSQGKYVYFEESFEDVFILEKRIEGIQICVKSA